MPVHIRDDEEPELDADDDVVETAALVDEFDDPEQTAAAARVAETEVAAGDLAELGELNGDGDDDSDPDVDATVAGVVRVLGRTAVVDDDVDLRPRTADEVLCSGCFLIVPAARIADVSGPWCGDCA